MSEIKTEIKQNSDGSYTITDAHSTADIVRWLLTQDSTDTILYLLNEEALQRTWVNATTWRGLTEEEIKQIANNCYSPYQSAVISFARAIEDKFKEKNT